MTQNKIQLYGIGNAIMDIIVDISNEDFESLMLTKGSMNLVSEAVQSKIFASIASQNQSLASGGSAGNTIIAFQQLGGRSAFTGLLGDDELGEFYHTEFRSLGIVFDSEFAKGKSTGTSLILVTPDSERTMNTFLGVAAELAPNHIKNEVVANSEWVYIEGYLLSQPETGYPAALELARVAKKNGAKVALTFSDGFLVSGFRKELDSIIELSDLIFANHHEAAVYTKNTDTERAFQALKQRVSNVVLTRSARGALIHYHGRDYDIKAFPCNPVDMTGAGDMYAGAFLYGVLNGYSPDLAGKGAAYLAMKVITQIGARLKGDIVTLWKEAIAL